jgi:catechol 2,3-dioxygenase-like lactoylglutathione lyase family enzyme
VESNPEQIQSISAVTLATSDMAASVTFYESLGFRLLYGGAEADFTSFRAGSGYLNLQLQRPTPGHSGVGAWGRAVFWVDDVDAMHRRAIAAGYLPVTSPADAPWGERYFHIHDPNGHELSFARPLLQADES